MKTLIIMCAAVSILTSTPFTTGFPKSDADREWVSFYVEFRQHVREQNRQALQYVQADDFDFSDGYGESISVVGYLDNKGGWRELQRLVRAGKVEGEGDSRTIFLGGVYATFTYSDGSWRWKSFSPESRFRLVD